uniref:zinc finger protein 112-like n=1 Tax=Styela clava TaxID=7725 RepID=UPI00193A8BC0|nr:zinc finger protein 112-like [Styela clava]
METVLKDLTYVEICLDEDIIDEASLLSEEINREKITSISGNTAVEDICNADNSDKYMPCEDTGEFTSHTQDTARTDINSTVIFEEDNNEFDSEESSVIAMQEQNEPTAVFVTDLNSGFLSKDELSVYLQQGSIDNAHQSDNRLITDKEQNKKLIEGNGQKLSNFIDNAHVTDNRQKSSDCNEDNRLSVRVLTTDKGGILQSNHDLIIDKDSYTNENYFKIARSLLNDIIDYIIEKEISDKTEICNICGRGFDSSAKLERHLEFHIRGRKIHYCSVCGKDYDQKSHLEYHMVRHTGVKPHTCEICGQSFTQKPWYNIHVKSHTSKPNVPCEICGRRFWAKHILNKHKRKHHSGLPFVCNICGSSFSGKQGLVQHVNVHPPHICETCGKEFNNYKSLRLHFPSHKPSWPEHVFADGVKGFRCGVCKRTFHRRQDLTFHSQAHASKVHKCQVCGAGFVRDSFLKKHMIAHSERPYKCELCVKSFHHKKSLENHQIYHTGIKHFGCHICGRRFYWKHRLAIHLKRHKNVKTENAVPGNDSEFAQQTSTLQCEKMDMDEASGIGTVEPNNGSVMSGNCISIGQKGNSQTSTFAIGEAEEFNLGSVKLTGHKIVFSPEVNSLSLPSEQTRAIAILDAESIVKFAMHNMSKKTKESVKVPKMANIMTIKEGDSDPYNIRTMGDEHS